MKQISLIASIVVVLFVLGCATAPMPVKDAGVGVQNVTAATGQFCSDEGCGNPYQVGPNNWEWRYMMREGYGYFYQCTWVESGLKISPHAIIQDPNNPQRATVIFLPGCIRGNQTSTEAIEALRKTGFKISPAGTEIRRDGSFAGAGRYQTDSHGPVEEIPAWAFTTTQK